MRQFQHFKKYQNSLPWKQHLLSDAIQSSTTIPSIMFTIIEISLLNLLGIRRKGTVLLRVHGIPITEFV